jgi:hypothetical protein
VYVVLSFVVVLPLACLAVMFGVGAAAISGPHSSATEGFFGTADRLVILAGAAIAVSVIGLAACLRARRQGPVSGRPSRTVVAARVVVSACFLLQAAAKIFFAVQLMRWHVPSPDSLLGWALFLLTIFAALADAAVVYGHWMVIG